MVHRYSWRWQLVGLGRLCLFVGVFIALALASMFLSD